MNLLTKTTMCALLGTLCLLFFHPTAEATNQSLQVTMTFALNAHPTVTKTFSLPNHFSIRHLVKAIYDYMANTLHIQDANAKTFVLIFKMAHNGEDEFLGAYDMRTFDWLYPGQRAITIELTNNPMFARTVNKPPAPRPSSSSKEN